MENINQLKLKVGTKYDIAIVMKNLHDFGYQREANANTAGTFSQSGGNITVFAANHSNPIRLEFFGTEIETISLYNQKDNKITDRLLEIIISPNIIKLDDGAIIKPDDFIVHEDHGIGIFLSMETKQIDGIDQLYYLITYLNNDTLHLPAEFKEKLSPYIGVGRRRPKLSKLGSVTWQKTYKKTYENVILLAKELLNIYAKRELAERKKWILNIEWDKEISLTFGYKETPDQDKAIADILGDIQNNKPIDRLVCGDVGFGKTEVAIRAMCQAAANGYQVAILVPTTILAEQHFITLKKRFVNLPVSIDRLTRFVKPAEQTEIISKINKGSVDITVATHRLFSANIKFKNLGLLVIDEEQKFGVKDKEKLKRLRAGLDVLSLTATPIPRTLFMSLSGIRDISQISSPPMGPKSIETKVAKYDEDLLKEYINREIKRKGQVYYLHNEVATIEGKRRNLEKQFPDLVIRTAHGQMKEETLADRMSQFADGKIDILVCSTIIENGLDLPNVNTLIVDESDKFGLSQLYQIRGRIGRSKNQAHALFTYKNKTITQNAFKRLKAIVENTELGSGYNISLSDLEIRGGGNILGKEQHGNMEAVGLVLYSKLLKRAVEKLRR